MFWINFIYFDLNHKALIYVKNFTGIHDIFRIKTLFNHLHEGNVISVLFDQILFFIETDSMFTSNCSIEFKSFLNELIAESADCFVILFLLGSYKKVQ